MRRHSLAQDQKLPQPERLADLRAGLPADDDRLELGQIAFELVGKLRKQLFADHEPENRVAQELQPLVRRQAMIGAGRVRQGRFEQLEIAELIPQPLLAALQAKGIVRIGDRLRRVNHDPILDFNRGSIVQLKRSWQLRPEEGGWRPTWDRERAPRWSLQA